MPDMPIMPTLPILCNHGKNNKSEIRNSSLAILLKIYCKV